VVYFIAWFKTEKEERIKGAWLIELIIFVTHFPVLFPRHFADDLASREFFWLKTIVFLLP
jgi:hypothetical protein